MTQTHRDALRYLSHSLSAPIIATPVFVALVLLESATILSAILSVFFATIVPVIGITGFARSEGLDYDIPEKRARARPFEIAILSYLAGFTTLVTIGAPVMLSGLMLAYLINTCAMFLITLVWKISVHAAGVTGPPQFPSLQARSSMGISLLTGDTSGADQNSFETTHAASSLGWCSSECRAYLGPDNIPGSIDPRMIIIWSELKLGLKRYCSSKSPAKE